MLTQHIIIEQDLRTGCSNNCVFTFHFYESKCKETFLYLQVYVSGYSITYAIVIKFLESDLHVKL